MKEVSDFRFAFSDSFRAASFSDFERSISRKLQREEEKSRENDTDCLLREIVAGFVDGAAEKLGFSLKLVFGFDGWSCGRRPAISASFYCEDSVGAASVFDFFSFTVVICVQELRVRDLHWNYCDWWVSVRVRGGF